MEQQEHPPEDVSWVQPEESLAFSVSPPASSGSNDARDEEHGEFPKSFSTSSRDGGELGQGDEEDPSLMGEYIWANGGGVGGAGSLDDERNASVAAAAATPGAAGEALHPRVSFDIKGFSSLSGHGSSSSPPPLGSNTKANCGFDEDDNSSGFIHLPPDAQNKSYGHEPEQPEQQQQQQEECRDDLAIEESERPLGLRSGEAKDEEYIDDSRNLAAQARIREDEDRPQHGAGVPPEQDWEGEDRGEDGGGWADDDEADFAPAWDQGRPAEFDSDSDSAGYGGIDQVSRTGSSVDEEGRLLPYRRDRQRRREGDVSPDFDTRENGRSNMDLRSGGGDGSGSSRSSNEEDIDGLVGPQLPNNRGRGESPSSRVVRRRTKLSLDRERRRLDRVPRSQRLSQVKGHPLGGMTLLQLEERHLLDVGIGQMTRQLAKRRGRGRGGGSRGAQQLNEDLLRRSARLLRRAQEERDARFCFEHARDFYYSRHTGGGGNSTPFSRASCDKSNGGGTGPRSAREGSKKRDRRPASASRDRSSRRLVSSSCSLEHAGGGTRDRAYTTSDYSRPTQTETWGCTLEGEAPPVGLYSGGGMRCSLKQRRPMSAKPALTCGSGWEPGRAKTRGHDSGRENGGGSDTRWDSVEDEDDPRGTLSRNLRGRGEEDEESGYSDVWDINPQGIVEYTDEEEGPFK